MEGPKFPSDIIGCDGECGFERRGSGWQCVDGAGCGRLVQRGEPGYKEISEYYAYWNHVDEKEVNRPKVRSVDAKELDPRKGLNAKSYVVDETTLANAIIHTWAHENHLSGFIRTNSSVMKDLRGRIAKSIRASYERGKRDG